MVELIEGDILRSDCFALVNPVNTEGAMGKGLASQFKLKYPHMFMDYKRACRKSQVHIGRMWLWFDEQNKLANMQGYKNKSKLIVNFPTKRHWSEKSTLKFIRLGLCDLVLVVYEYKIKSIAIPALGCGEGKLKWEEVHPLIVSSFNDILPKVRVMLYGPLRVKWPIAHLKE